MISGLIQSKIIVIYFNSLARADERKTAAHFSSSRANDSNSEFHG
jgi:hypothetical protein